ncbi:carbohydrate ABC transporter permease [Lysinibacter sp. HNR]|uniref:carbohydrate ABC transporter permease n=1 Tax=Lysinibacter sp. HNR TaxID=3031408 RepID=UPI002434FEB1|nr:carbohydrate ABC transporter permease [Lysinibacter sp. HNR]WGD37517.1 carbohydrate ABC transporter permease [Lysinibacter sp. HNR]
MKQKRSEQIIGHAVLIVGAFLALYPFASILLLSLSPSTRGGTSSATSVTFENYLTAWTRGSFDSALISSAIVALAVVLGAGIFSTLGGYALATMKFRGKWALAALLLVGLVVPYEGLIIPLYYQLEEMGLLNTYWALILPQIATSVSLGVFWMRTFFVSVPTSLLEAARVDGASRFGALLKIYLPIAWPALGTLSVLLFLFTWNEFLMPLVLVSQNPDVQTAPLSLSFFAGSQRTTDPAVTAAAAVIVALPILIVYVFLQRRFISGIVSGAVKE